MSMSGFARFVVVSRLLVRQELLVLCVYSRLPARRRCLVDP